MGYAKAKNDVPNTVETLSEICNIEIAKTGLANDKSRDRLASIDIALSQTTFGSSTYSDLKEEQRQLTLLHQYCVTVLQRSTKKGTKETIEEFINSFRRI